MSSAHCEECGADARLCVLAGYKNGEPVLRYRCLSCADRPVSDAIEGKNSNRFGPGALLIMIGGLLGLMAALADGMPGSDGIHAGFGFKQQLGVTIGSLLVVFGAILRIDFIGIAGTLLFFMALGSDLLGFVRTPGVGWKQQGLFVAAGIIVAVGLIIRTRARMYYRRQMLPDAAALKAGAE